MNKQPEKKSRFLNILYVSARNGAVISAIFSVIMCTLIITTYIQLHIQAPLESPALAILLQRLNQNPEDDSLKEEIRSLDYLARKAYFVSIWQFSTGGIMLLIGVCFLGACLLVVRSFKKKDLLYLKQKSMQNIWLANSVAGKIITVGGMVIAIFSLIIAFGAGNIFSSGDIVTQTDQNNPATILDAGVETGSIENISTEPPYSAQFFNNWPNFRGPMGTGISAATNPPVEWNGKTGKNIIWKTEVPLPGNNSPVVWEDRIFLSGADKKVREVFCFSRETGNLLWRKSVDNIPGTPLEAPKVSDDTGYAAPTVATEGQHVCAIFATGDLICFDFQGNRMWARNLGVPENHYGHASSLITYKDTLLVQYDHDKENEAKLIALDIKSGQILWQVNRPYVYTSWASPILVNTGNRHEIILSTNPTVTSYNPHNGEELWSIEILIGEIGSSPTYSNGIVFAANEYALLAAINTVDGTLLWESYDYLPDAASLLAYNNLVIVPTSYGVVSCRDAATGDIYWVQEFDTGFYSSPLLAGNRVYLQDMNGNMKIFLADKEFKLISTASLGEPSVCTAAIVEERIYIRGARFLYCIGKTDE